MDPVPLITDTNSSYNLAEIWAFSVNGVGDVSHGGFLQSVGPRRAQLVQNLAAETSNRDVSVDESTLTEQSAGGESKNHAWKKRRQLSEDESSKLIISSSSAGNNNTTDYQGKRLKVMAESREENVILKAEVEASSGFGNKQGEHSVQLPAEAPRQDYIHVRARRGQATDSHSLAERARREKISERMKILQDLVPGCNKVIGKALVLDEIINYIQSLQRQVEFLSMKLEAVNSRMNSSNLEGFPAKDLGVQTYEAANMAFGSQATASYGPRSPQEWLHMQVGGGFDRAT